MAFYFALLLVFIFGWEGSKVKVGGCEIHAHISITIVRINVDDLTIL